MRKLKLYLDTSTISHLFAEDTPEKMNDTHILWDGLINGKYEIFISPVVIDEIRKCPEPRQSKMFEKLEQLKFQVLREADEVFLLADEYIKGGVLREKSRDDCLHIAYAVVYSCDAIVSWNFKHLVNFKIINKIRVVNTIHMYKEIGIISPTMLIEEDEE
ncbi:MAG: type II toxin-antitoxin system VapC family toxin [Defluviitaleaceae bacterium]|nr:type II toxin-antitoxin system VapC family toxin [Defluviitaleaceae bacterium]